MSPVGAIFVPFSLKTGTNLLHPLLPSIIERVASQSVDLGPRRNDGPVCDKPVRAVVGSLIWLGGMTRPDIANAVRAVARQAHDPAERHWLAVRKIIAYLIKTKDLGLVFAKDGDRKLSVYVDADYAKKDNDRRSVSGVAVTVGGHSCEC